MKREEIIYIIRRERKVEIPSLQQKYGIPYGEIKSVIDELVEKGELKYRGGIRYEHASDSEGKRYSGGAVFEHGFRRQNTPPNSKQGTQAQNSDTAGCGFDINDEEELRKRALKLCIERNSASVLLLQRFFPIGYLRASNVIDWMEDEGYISTHNGAYPRKVLITREEFEEIFNPEVTVDDDFDFESDDEDPFSDLKEFEVDIAEVAKENERHIKGAISKLADVLKQVALKKEQEEAKRAKENKKKSTAKESKSFDLEEKLPEHPSWDNEFEFIRTVRKNIELIITSDRNMGVLGAIKKAKDMHWEFNDLGNKRLEEVFERVVFELEHTSPYQYAKLKKKYFV